MNAATRLRRRLVVLSRDEFVRARRAAPELLVDDFTSVVHVPLVPPDSETPELSAMADKLEPGAVFVRNRWRGDRYVPVDTALEDIALAKYSRFAAVCQLLGASRLELQEVREFGENGRLTGSIAVSRGPLSAEASGTSNTAAQLAQRLESNYVWGTDSPSDPDAAAALILESGLDDPVIDGLLVQRRNTTNALREYKLDLDISSEARREVHFALQLRPVLRALTGVFEPRLQRVAESTSTLRVRLFIQF